MAKFVSHTFGQISGKHGTAVAAVVNGKSILRKYTEPKNPNSEKQQEQRLKFSMVQGALNPFRSVITIGYGSKQGFSKAVSLALRNMVAGTFPNYTFAYSNLMLSTGTLPQAASVNLAKGADTNVTAQWDTTVWESGSDTDGVNVVFYNETTKTIFFSQSQATRVAGALTIPLPTVWLGQNVHCWLFFSTPAGSMNSVSQYLGLVTL